MNKSTLKSCASAVSLVAMSLAATPAFAQDAPAAVASSQPPVEKTAPASSAGKAHRFP